MTAPVTDEEGVVAECAQAFTLKQNWPNPFNASTTIYYVLPSSVHVSLSVYDLLSREVVTLVEGSHQEAGDHRVCWDGKDREGRAVSSGTYLYRLQAGGVEEHKTMTLLR